MNTTTKCNGEECRDVMHASDCSVHNMPAYPPGPCDCGALDERDRLRAALQRIADLTAVYTQPTTVNTVPLDDAPEVLAQCVAHARFTLDA